MSTAARKARKRAGIKFEKPAKVGTPVEQRAHVINRQDGAAVKHATPAALNEWRAARAAQGFFRGLTYRRGGNRSNG